MKRIVDSIEENFAGLSIGEIYENIICHVEKMLIEKALDRSFGNQAMASKILGLSRNTLHKKVKHLKIDVTRFKR
ncbi:MAG: helix-turn-helix domain-containing protein [Candidatus Omnitrophota bacterium]|jgi:DNA-binding protein Fis